MIEALKLKITASYESGITMEEAERLASELLVAQMNISEDLKSIDLDARMRKSGLKTIKSAVRQEELKRHEKKPTEGHLDDVVNLDSNVQVSQDALDAAEVNRDYLKSTFDVLREAHVHFRGIAKGRYE